MALLYNFGTVLADADEVAEKFHLGDFHTFDKRAKRGIDAQIDFRSGTLNVNDFLDNTRLNLPPFTQPEIGSPLSIEILAIYTGDAPQKFFGGKKDLLVTSGVKSVQTYGGALKAINQLVEKVGDHQYLQPGAFTQGSPIVYYTKAIDVATVFTSFELIAESFPEETFDVVARLFSSAGSLPIFAPANGYLLVGAALIKMAGKLGKALFESSSFLREDIPFRFDTPDQPITKAKQLVICNDSDKQQFMAYRPGLINDGNGNQRPALVERTTFKEYRGNAPYILINIDGRERKALEGYTPKAASASIIEKFYGSSVELQEVTVLEEAMTLYNDFYYYQKANDLAHAMSLEQTDGMHDAAAFQKATQLYKAYVKNIRNELFLKNLENDTFPNI